MNHHSIAPKKQSSLLACFVALVCIVLITRPYHFTTLHYLPDASLAAFFILGFLQLRHRYFTLLLLECVIIDLSVSFYDQVFGDCITPSYPFLVLGYYILWWFGKTSHFTIEKTVNKKSLNLYLMTLVSLCFAVTIAFTTSTISYYYFSGLFIDLHIINYIDRVSGFLWQSQISSLIYVVAAHIIYRYFNANAQSGSAKFLES